jgi:hypothetical protein
MLVSTNSFHLLFFYRYNLDTTRKRYSAEKHLSKNLEEKDRIGREFVKKREKVNFPSIMISQGLLFLIFFFIYLFSM